MERSRHILFIPGLVCTGDLFAPQFVALAGVAHLHVANHRKHDTIEAIAADILKNAPPTFALCGLSMGGYIAFEIMRQAPQRVERLALLDTAASPETSAARARRLTMIGMAEAGNFAGVHKIFWPLFVHPARLDDRQLQAQVFAMIDDTGPEVFVRQQRAIMSRADARPGLGSVACPTLVLAGAQDILTPVAAAQEIASGISGAKLEIVEHCGHLSTLERPDEVNAALRQWLDSNPA